MYVLSMRLLASSIHRLKPIARSMYRTPPYVGVKNYGFLNKNLKSIHRGLTEILVDICMYI